MYVLGMPSLTIGLRSMHDTRGFAGSRKCGRVLSQLDFRRSRSMRLPCREVDQNKNFEWKAHSGDIQA